jgi:hypothetical protein
MKTKTSFRRKTAFLVFILSLLIVGHLAFAAEFKLKVKKADAEIRLKPTVESTLISKAPLGAILESSEKFGEWFKVNLPPDKQGIVVSGYIHQSAVEIMEEIKEPLEQEAMRDEPEPRLEDMRQPAGDEKKKKYALRVGLGLAFPSGEWADLFNLGLGVMIGNSWSLVQNQTFDVALIGSFDGYIFFRESRYTDISWARLLLAADLRFSLKVEQFSIFGQGGAGVYLDIIEVSDWWGRTSDSEFRFGPRIGGGISFGTIEILGLYHLVEDKMFSLMLVWTYRF